MFIAKFLDQKQGEARVVDQQQILRDRLDAWLKSRPSPADLAARGILGRGARFVAARDILDQFLRARAQAQAEEAVKIPVGTFEYTEAVQALLSDVGKDTVDGAPEEMAGINVDSCRTLEQQLQAFRHECEKTRARLDTAAGAWSQASDECRHKVCTGALRDAATRSNRALELLEAHRTSTGDSLADVFADLRTFQRLTARQTCLQGIVAVVEKTDVIREAVFACRGVNQVPLTTLEELPELCAGLPSRSRRVGVQRLQFLIAPLRRMVVQELQEQLRKTEQWPLDLKARCSRSPATAVAEMEVVRLCADLQRVEQVQNDLRRRLRTEVCAAETMDDGCKAPWACSALAAPLIIWFHRLFQKPELRRMDKPEWYFSHLMKSTAEYGDLLSKWVSPALAGTSLEPIQKAALKGIDLPIGLAIAIAYEARLFIRARLPLLAEPDEKANLLHTLKHLVGFHGEIVALAGPVAGTVVLADFDENRPLREPTPPASGAQGLAAVEEGPAVANDSFDVTATDLPQQSPGSASNRGEGTSLGFMAGLSHLKRNEPEPSGGFMGGLSHLKRNEPGPPTGGFMAGLSHLRRNEPEPVDERSRLQRSPGKSSDADDPFPDGERGTIVDAGLDADVSLRLRAGKDNLLTGLTNFADAVVEEANGSSSPEKIKPEGFLDVWAAADSEFIVQKLSTSLKPECGNAWHRRQLKLGGVATLTGAAEVAKEEPEALEVATLIADLFDKSRSRAECLSATAAREIYSERVLGGGLRLGVAAIRERWNGLNEPLKDARESAAIVETLEEVCRFMDRFPLAVHFVAAVDDTNTLRLGMLEKLADALVGAIRPMSVLRQLQLEAGVFSYILAPPLIVLSKRLRPSNFLAVSQRCVKSIADVLLRHLLWHAPFTDREHMAAFISNCHDDLSGILTSVLDGSELRCLRSLWDGCALLALPEGEAKSVLAALRHVERCSPAHALRRVQDAQEPESQVEENFESPVVGEVLRQRRAEVFAAAGIKDLSVPDAISVLGKRPELIGTLSDLQDAPFGVLQDLLPATALAQTTLQLGADALQQFQAPLPAAAVDVATGAAHAAAAQARQAQESLRTGAAELRSMLPGSVFNTVGRVASSLRPLKAK